MIYMELKKMKCCIELPIIDNFVGFMNPNTLLMLDNISVLFSFQSYSLFPETISSKTLYAP